jgi:hypothetical protein
MVFQLIILSIMTVLGFTAFFMLRYMRKHPPKSGNGTVKA